MEGVCIHEICPTVWILRFHTYHIQFSGGGRENCTLNFTEHKNKLKWRIKDKDNKLSFKIQMKSLFQGRTNAISWTNIKAQNIWSISHSKFILLKGKDNSGLRCWLVKGKAIQLWVSDPKLLYFFILFFNIFYCF